MNKTKRRESILEELKKEKEVSINLLKKLLGVSVSTIHRDLDELEREGHIKKVFGGIVLVPDETPEIFCSVRLNTNPDLKRKIAKKALNYIENKDCIFIDNSSTGYYFAKALSQSNIKNIIIVTYSNLIPNLFVNNYNIQVVSTGGFFNKEMNCFMGTCAINTINEFNANKFFFSVAGVSINSGLTDFYDVNLTSLKRAMFNKSNEKICIVDSTKFEKIWQHKMFDFKEINNVITDNNIDNKILTSYLSFCSKVIIAS